MAGGTYQPKPHRMDPMRESGFRMSWSEHMAERYTVIDVRCSTEPQPEDEPLHIYKRPEPEGDAWLSVIDHLTWQAAMGALQPGVWTITVPGTDRKHSFEVE